MSSLHIPALPVFVDIETCSQLSNFSRANEALEYIWKSKFKHELEPLLSDRFSKTEQFILNRHYLKNAAFYAEFGKIVCISIGIFDRTNVNLRIKTLCGDDELQLLQEFKQIVGDREALCGHNLTEFDAPYLSRRMIVHGISLPPSLQNMNKKPWEVKNEDTMNLWRFGSFKHAASLAMLAYSFGLPDPKTDLSGDKVGEVYWAAFGNDLTPDVDKMEVLKRIAKYCANDVQTLVNIYMRIKNLPVFREDQFVIV